MDAQRLSSIAVDAVSTVLNFHNRHISHLDDMYQRTIHDAVARLWPLREIARCPQVAYLEIAADAAVTCAEVFNEKNPGQALNKLWVYNCVQNLLTIQLKPQLVDGAVGRLMEPLEGDNLNPGQHLHNNSSSKSFPTFPSSASASTTMVHDNGLDDEDDLLYEGDDDDSDEYDNGPIMSDMEMADGDDDNDHDNHVQSVWYELEALKIKPKPRAVTKKIEPKTPWTEADIKQMVRLKDFEGLTHEEVALRIGRGKGSVENKYGRVVKEDKWRLYAEACRTRSGRAGTTNKRRVRDDNDDDENDAGGDHEGAWRPLKKRLRR